MQVLIQAASLITAFIVLALLAVRPSSPKR
jgi:hypothetical protein